MQPTILNMKYEILENIYKDIYVADQTSHMDIYVDKRINASMMITYDEIKDTLPVEIVLEEGSVLTVFMKNISASLLQIKLHAVVKKDATLRLAYCDLDCGNVDFDGTISLLEQGAVADLSSACIVESEKKFKLLIEHCVPHTTGIMEHYAVVKENAIYHMDAIGKIDKGAYGSISHQTTRVLTMSESHNSVVSPQLLIDENDVKASHATTLGQPDENQLYYLQTRGLSREQALGLLSVGYIMPITKVFDDPQHNEKLKNEIEMKVGLHA